METVTDGNNRSCNRKQELKNRISTAKTKDGVGTTDTETKETWNDWQEASVTTPLATATEFREGDPQFRPSTTSSLGELFAALSLGTTLVSEPVKCGYQELQGELSGCGKIYDRRAEIHSAFWGAVHSTLWDESQPTWKRVLKLASCAVPPIGATCANQVASGFWARNHEFVLRQQQADPDSSVDRGAEGNPIVYSPATGNISVQPIFQLSVPQLSPPTQTNTVGSSRGGAQTTTHTQYQEQSVTNGETFF